MATGHRPHAGTGGLRRSAQEGNRNPANTEGACTRGLARRGPQQASDIRPIAKGGACLARLLDVRGDHFTHRIASRSCPCLDRCSQGESAPWQKLVAALADDQCVKGAKCPSLGG